MCFVVSESAWLATECLERIQTSVTDYSRAEALLGEDENIEEMKDNEEGTTGDAESKVSRGGLDQGTLLRRLAQAATSPDVIEAITSAFLRRNKGELSVTQGT